MRTHKRDPFDSVRNTYRTEASEEGDTSCAAVRIDCPCCDINGGTDLDFAGFCVGTYGGCPCAFLHH